MNENLNNIMNMLDECTRNYAASQIIGELEVVVERLGFARLGSNGEVVAPSDELKRQIDFLLDRDVSPGILAFVEKLMNANCLGVLLQDAGQMFLAYCQTHYGEMKQVTCKVAVQLNETLQHELRARLLVSFPPRTRLVFVTEPNLVSGFVLMDGVTKLADASLRSQTMPAIEAFIRRRVRMAPA